VNYESFADYSFCCLGIPPLPPITIPERSSWKITAPDFDANSVSSPPSSPVVVPVAQVECHFASFGEFASAVLGCPSYSLVTHVAWDKKTPTVVLPYSSSQALMAYQFVDPAPFLPNGAQQVMILGRPLMKRVVTEPILERNNDVAIALLAPPKSSY
jgi:hypothetical protein